MEIHLANPAHREIIIDDSQVLRQPSIIFVIFHRFWFNLFPFADILSFAPSSIILDYILEKLDLILIIHGGSFRRGSRKYENRSSIADRLKISNSSYLFRLVPIVDIGIRDETQS